MLQVHSDFHLETRVNLVHVRPSADYLALLGDIGDPLSPAYQYFLSECCDNFKHVIVLTGNHEYQHMKPVDTVHKGLLRFMQSKQNCTYLNNDDVLLKNTRIIGSTFWTHVPPEAADAAVEHMSDYKKIYVTEYGRLTVSASNWWHQEAVDFIDQRLRQDSTTPTVVLTHHPPIDEDILHPPQHHQSPVRSCYASDNRQLLRAPVHTWAFGHTHQHVDYVDPASGVRLLSNPLGYNHEADASAICPALIKLF
jgi:predicted phosphohydrolase